MPLCEYVLKMTKFLFDLDGTLTRFETLPLIARHFHIKREIEQLTRDTVMGNVSFEESFRRRVEILGKLPVNQVAEFLSGAELYPLAVKFIREHAENCRIVTGNLSCWTEPLIRKIGCKFHASEALVSNNRIQKIVSVLPKSEIVRQYQRAGYMAVFIGDGNNDVEAMHVSDTAIAAALTHTPSADVLSAADYCVTSDSELYEQLNELAEFSRRFPPKG